MHQSTIKNSASTYTVLVDVFFLLKMQQALSLIFFDAEGQIWSGLTCPSLISQSGGDKIVQSWSLTDLMISFKQFFRFEEFYFRWFHQHI